MYKRLFAFGLFFTLIAIFMSCNMLTMDTLQMGDRLVTQAQFRSMIWPVAALCAMALAGLALVVYSLRHIIIDRHTNAIGTEAYGIIAGVFDSQLRINRVAQQKASVLVFSDDGDIIEASEYLGNNRARYRAGDYVRVKYLENDINILCRVDRSAVPPAAVELLEQRYSAHTHPDDSIIY